MLWYGSSYPLEASEKSESPSIVVVGGRSAKATLTPFPSDGRTQRILKQEQIIHEGTVLVEQGRYDEAIQKYKEALDPSFLNEEDDRGHAIYYIEKVYKLQGKYEEALRELQWSIDHNRIPNIKGEIAKPQKPELPKLITAKERLYEEIQEINALLEYKKTGSKEPVYKHIEFLRVRYKSMLPPKRYQSTGYSTIVTSEIIRLYDHIADYDAGIAFVDSVVNYFYSKNKSLRRVTTSQEALKKAEERGKHWRDYKKIYEYLKVREAFEADKKEGRQSCVGKTGVCIGRATQALIQSDYFPW